MSIRVPYQKPRKDPPLIAFVGEAPGVNEVLDKRPFTGPSGNIFNSLLRAAGIEREDCLITNVFDQKAEDNDVVPWMKDETVYGPALERLSKELARHDPAIIVPLGATALWALKETTQIGSYRGNPTLATRCAAGKKLLPTFHPAIIMKQWKFYSVCVADLMRAEREALKGPEITYPKRELMLRPSLKEAREFLLDECLNADLLSVDIETGWGQITCIGFAPSAERAMCVPFVDRSMPDRSYWRTEQDEFQAWRSIETVLASDVPKLGQNFQYDKFWLEEKAGMVVNNYREDTRLLHHALYAELPKDLEFMASSYSDQGSWKNWGNFSKEKRDA